MLTEAEIKTFELVSRFTHSPMENIDDFAANYRAAISALCQHIRELQYENVTLEERLQEITYPSEQL